MVVQNLVRQKENYCFYNDHEEAKTKSQLVQKLAQVFNFQNEYSGLRNSSDPFYFL